MNRGILSETDESIVRASTRSPEGWRRYPRFTPGTKALGCAHLNFPPAGAKTIVQSSAGGRMPVRDRLRTYPREIGQVLLRSLREFDVRAPRTRVTNRFVSSTKPSLTRGWWITRANFMIVLSSITW